MQQTSVLEEPGSIALRTLELVEKTSINIFLTGKAGTGKTTFLRNLSKRNFKPMLICAPTGIAALNAGGVTLHSMMGIPPCAFVPDAMPANLPYGVRVETPTSIVKNLALSSIKRNQIRRASLLVIDEVSMLRADMLDATDHIMKFVRRSKEPFGGMQMLFIGDLMQLPPVIKNDEWNMLSRYYPSPYFFDAKVLRAHAPLRVELTTIYRQKDQEFAALLNRMRSQELTNEDVEKLNQHYIPGFSQKAIPGTVTLTTHNRVADTINQEALQELTSPLMQFSATVDGEFPESMFPCERELKLKIGAQVMFIKNDLQQPSRFFNGKMGVVEGEEEGNVVIKTEGGSKIFLEPHLWENIRYTPDAATGVPVAETIGRFLQYPLRLAWAITIHKSQGLTFENAAIDVQNVFASGQCYVAFSRLRSLNGLTLITPFQKKDLSTDKQLISYESQPSQAESHFLEIEHHKKKYFIKNLEKTVSFYLLKQHFSRLSEQSSIMQSLMNVVEKEVLAGMQELSEKGKNIVNSFASGSPVSSESVLDWTQSTRHWLKTSLSRLVTLHLSLPEPSGLWIQFASDLEFSMGELWQEVCFIDTLIDENEQHVSSSWLKEWKLYREQWTTLGRVSKKKEAKIGKIKTPKKQTISSRKITLQLLREGKSIAHIATERNFTEGTIGDHITKLINEKELRIEEVLSIKRIQELSEIILRKPTEESLWQYHKRALGGIPVTELRWVNAYLEQQDSVSK